MDDQTLNPQMPDRMRNVAAAPSEMRQRLAETDWSKTPLGPMADWSESLKATVGLIMASGFPMGVRWGPTLTYIYNDAFISILGARHPQAFGGNIDDPIWDDIGGDLRPLSRAIMRGEHPGLFAKNHVWRNRRYGVPEDAHFTLSYSPVPDPTAPHGVGGVLLTAIETTEESYAEERLRHLTLKLEEEVAQRTRERDGVWKASEDLMAVTDFTGAIHSVNPAWKLLGWSEDELKRMNVEDLRHPDDAAAAKAQRQRLESGVAQVRLQNRFRHKNGTWHWFSWTLANEGDRIYVIGRDISIDKENVQRVYNSERDFRTLIGAVTDYAIFRLMPDGTVASWNAGAERAKGYFAHEIIGQNFRQFYTPEDQDSGLPERLLERAAREGRAEAEGWRVRKDGTRFWANVVIDPIYDENGNLNGFAKITRDITERRETQLQLERTQEQLAQARKMDALGQLTGGIAHDFNNMLMVVGGYAQFLKQRLSDPKDKRAIDAIEFAAGRAENLTRQLLTFSRRQSLNRVTVRLPDCFATMRDILATTAKGNIRLDIAVPDTVWPVTIDVNEFEVAIINLLVNAHDAMPNGGIIRIAARNATINEASGADQLRGDFVLLDVVDEGSGIPAEILSKVFEPFFTTKGIQKGTGLGLSQVYGFAHQGRGTVRLASKVGAGTTVTLYLPRGNDAVTSLGDDDQAASIVGGNETILLVEDNAEVQGVASRMLEQLGYKVIFADSATKAMTILTPENKIDLLLTDIVMPGPLDGIALAQHVSRQFRNIGLLLTTGYSQEAAARSPFPVLRKPYRLATMARAVRNALDQRRTGQRSSAGNATAGDRLDEHGTNSTEPG